MTLEELLTETYNAGYMAGHHDTVEGGYIDINPDDLNSYHSDVAEEIMSDLEFSITLRRA